MGTASLSGEQQVNGTTKPTNDASPSPNSTPTQPVPHIHHITPSAGPIFGGIEVSILGAGFPFHNACTFGGSTADTIWQTETGRLCVLPRNPTPGPVEVRFQEVPVMGDTQIFTYEDTREKDACVFLITTDESVSLIGVL